MPPKKKKQKPEVQEMADLFTAEVDEQMFCESMRRFVAYPEYKLWIRGMQMIRESIINSGKQKPSEAAWAKLDGFDLGARMASKSASKKSGADLMKERREALMAGLHGDKK